MKLLKSLQYLGLGCLLCGMSWLLLQSHSGVVNEARQTAAWLLIWGGSAWFGLSRFIFWLIQD